jgi:hypothetical protein
MHADQARKYNEDVAEQHRVSVYAAIECAARVGKVMVDYQIPDETDDLFDYYVVPKLEENGYRVDTFNGSSSDINGGAMYRTLRICWHPKP